MYYFIKPGENPLTIIKKEINVDYEKFPHNLKLLEEWCEQHMYLPENYGR